MIQFANFDSAEQTLVDQIVQRALPIFRDAGIPQTRLDIEMDIAAVHAVCPLKLAELRDADKFNFTHDIAGIYRHLNRRTGELEDCFVPRFAQPAPEEVE